LVAVKEAGVSGDGGEAGGDYPLQYLGDSLEEDNNPKGSRRVVIRNSVRCA